MLQRFVPAYVKLYQFSLKFPAFQLNTGSF